MGCGASTVAPEDKYVAATHEPTEKKGGAVDADAKKKYVEATKARTNDTFKYDVVLSYEPSYCSSLYEVVESELGKSYSVGKGGVENIAMAAQVIFFLSPPFFKDEKCCADFCEAVKLGVEVVLVCVDGSNWGGAPFPALKDVPAGATRDAASVIFGYKIAIEHKSAYLAAFVEKLRQRLGPPQSMKSLKKVAAPAPISGDRTIRFDAFLSHKRSDAQDTAARVHDKLTDLGYRAFIDRNDLVELASLKLAVRDTATFVCFLTPNYFKSAWCCLEICQAVESGVNVLFVQMEGCAFPSPSDVPETMVVHDEEDITLKPREAFTKVIDSGARISHSKAFFGTCIEGMQAALGPPPAVAGLDGEAKDMWKAAGGGTTIKWEKVRAQLKKSGGKGYADCEAIVSKALGVPSVDDGSATVSAVAFAALFSEGTKFKELVDALSGGASAKASAEEKLVPVKIVPEAEGAEEIDGGLALVGPGTSLEEVRAQLRETYEEERADDELLSTGRFTFLATDARKAVKRKQEKLIRGKNIDSPIVIKIDPNAKLSLKDAADEVKESAAEAQKAKAAKAAKELIAAGARREATMLDLDVVMRDPLRAASLRRHAAEAAGKDGTTRAGAEKEAQIAILSLKLNDALAKNDGATALKAAETLRSFGKEDGITCPTDASPQAIAELMRVREMTARAALSPALERMRAEMFYAASGGGVKSGKATADMKDLKRVVILGGGPCGGCALHQLVHIHAGFHVTIVDTKEYYEDTPCILRLMAGNDADHLWKNITIPFADIIRDAKNAEFICGTAAAVRKDHVLVGTTNGVASRVVPFDYLILSTGSFYQSDIKTEGASIAHRKESFAMERERMAEVDNFSVVGAGLVGIQMACELRHYFPEKEVNVYTRAGGWLPRVPEAHGHLHEECTKQGVKLIMGEEIVSTDADGRMVTKKGKKLGPAGARTYWCTGYKPNNSYIKDSRTDADIASELDEGGFVKVDKANRMNADKGLGHIFAGGDLACAFVHNQGERTAAGAAMHAGVIVQNILLAAGKREGGLKQAAINFFAGTDLEVSLGPKAGMLYATNPAFESFFKDPEALKAKYGPMLESGRKGWQEIAYGGIEDMGCVNWMMFSMIPDGFAKMLKEDDMTIWGMFMDPAIIDLTFPVADEKN